MAPSLLPPVRFPGDRMWLKALSTRRGIHFLPVCSDLFTREVTLWFSDPGSAIGRRRLAWPGGAARAVCDTLPSDPIIHDWRGCTPLAHTWSPLAVHSEGRSRATWPRPLGHRRPIGSRVTSLNVSRTELLSHPVCCFGLLLFCAYRLILRKWKFESGHDNTSSGETVLTTQSYLFVLLCWSCNEHWATYSYAIAR